MKPLKNRCSLCGLDKLIKAIVTFEEDKGSDPFPLCTECYIFLTPSNLKVEEMMR